MRCVFKNQLAECLAAKGVKKSQMAFRLRMSRAYVTRLVNGDVHPSLETAIRIARYFHKPVEEVFQLEEVNAAAPSVPKMNFPGVPPSAPGEPTNLGGENKK